MKKGVKQNQDFFEIMLNSEQKGNDPYSLDTNSEPASEWHADHEEGQLAVDVLQEKDEVVIVCPMAGSIVEKVEVHVNNDLVTIRGERLPPLSSDEQQNYFHQECFWGKFSRSIVLPVDVKGDHAKAEYNNGVLIIRIPKRHTNTRIPVVVVEE